MSRFFFLARRFVAGESLEAAVDVVRSLNDDGLDVTLNMLGEATREREEADEAVRQYLVMLDLIRDEVPLVPLMYGSTVVVHAWKVRDVRVGTTGMVAFAGVELDA